MATQAAQTIPATIVIDLEAKLDQFVQNFEDKLDSIVQRLQAQQKEHRQGMREIFANFFPETACDEPPTMKNQEHHELHQSFQRRIILAGKEESILHKLAGEDVFMLIEAIIRTRFHQLFYEHIQDDASRDKHIGFSSDYEGSQSHELSGGANIRRNSRKLNQVRDNKEGYIRSMKQSVVPRSQSKGVDLGRVFCFGFQRTNPQMAMKGNSWRSYFYKEEINNNVAPRTEPYGDQATQVELMSFIMVEGNTYGYGNEWEGLLEDFKTIRQVKRQSTTEFTKGKDMRFYGFISCHKVVVVIDSGATNNFISDELALVLKLPTSTTNQASVLLGQRQCIQTIGTCFGINLLVQEVEINENFLLLDLTKTDVDVILGYGGSQNLERQWLIWLNQDFSFFHNQQWVTLCAKDKELEQVTTKVKMKSEYEQEKIDHYLEDKVVLKGGSKAMWGGIAKDIPWKQKMSGESLAKEILWKQKISGESRKNFSEIMLKVSRLKSAQTIGNYGGLEAQQGSLGVMPMGYKGVGEKQEEFPLRLIFIGKAGQSPRPPELFCGKVLGQEGSLFQKHKGEKGGHLNLWLMTNGGKSWLEAGICLKLQNGVFECCKIS
ncbi:Eukaryotic aspartyl protease family protein [Arabidopsis thaliana]|uniref:Eukaryotic aspartyl protease family protein n=1 Tax=Arabidopsis thaliana TaxID=3702 RepID=F4J7U9_ARATH|nr:Eukaryotic aspartyl protease family protein [Arabidopsis thaliana]AEE77658.1 Eukaryotic aspartyl protease family protein [Arabidopsis thaliana]|eukprot:NP_189700.4 Eukaryotic aspartyl protease family protein [Arabidopsis thaliana]